ncbi:MAG TPA: glycosyltransferase [Pyrinomonadaceae bacterium]|jgi:GT2 family glycosyltransferase
MIETNTREATEARIKKLFELVREHSQQVEQLRQYQSFLEQEVEAKNHQLSAQETKLNEQSEELSSKAAEVTRLQGQLASALIDARQREEELSRVQERISTYESQINRQSDELSKMHAQLSSYRTQLNQLAYMLSDARTQLSNKKALLNWMIQSRSWKLTSTLRRASLFSDKLKQRLPRSGRDVFSGYVDAPAEGGVASGQIEIVGWAYSSVAPVVRVEAFLDNMPLGALRYGHARPDVVEAFPSQAPIDCGYANHFPLDELHAGRRTLMIRVTDEQGNYRDYKRKVVIEANDSPLTRTPIALPEDFGKAPEEVVESFLGDNLSTSKKILTSMASIALDNFLLSNATIEIPRAEHPVISIILVLYNRAELTLQCLYSILKTRDVPFEIILVDNASTDETRFLLKRIRGAQIIENVTNRHYLLACNQAAQQAVGEYILLLNNDTQILADSLSSALETIRSSEDIGAVGGKVILPDGTLQEAGSIIWHDGSCSGYGRGDSPSAPTYMFRRDVDYCSAAFLLTRRELFLQGGGFDETFAPAYYEETDYCVRLWKQGKRVVYDPNVIVLHYEFASSGSQRSAISLQAKHQKLFAERHRDWLQARHQINSPKNVIDARSARRPDCRRILFIDDRVPHVNLGSGFPRSNRILTELVRMGHQVTFYPLSFPKEDWTVIYQDIPREVEVMVGYGLPRLEEFLGERSRYYDFVFVSRPHNMASLKSLLTRKPHLCPDTKIIYDAEALFSLRDIGQARLEGNNLSTEDQSRLINEEIRLAENCHCIISVSEKETLEFTRYGFDRVHTLGHSISASPTPASFEERRDILFVGSMSSLTSPNADSMVWFIERIFPLIKKQLGQDIMLNIAGPICLSLRNRFANESVQVFGKMDDLTELYNRSRLFVAPTRFSAGIPHKAHEAASRGLPMVATKLIGEQLGWRHAEELLVADSERAFADACVRLYQDAELWNRLRENALHRIQIDCSPSSFSERLRAIIR